MAWAHTYTDTDTDAHIDTHPNTDTYIDTHTHWHIHIDTHGYTYMHTHRRGQPHREIQTHTHNLNISRSLNLMFKQFANNSLDAGFTWF